jgi:hypothetical protein
VTVEERFGANVKRLRRRLDLSPGGASRARPGPPDPDRVVERGLRLGRIDTLVKLCGALEAEPNDLLQGLSWEPPPHQRDGRFLAEG